MIYALAFPHKLLHTMGSETTLWGSDFILLGGHGVT